MKNCSTSLVILPVIITISGQYVTRGGEAATVTRVSNGNDFGCVGAYASGALDCWHRSGRLYFHIESRNDIIAKENQS